MEFGLRESPATTNNTCANLDSSSPSRSYGVSPIFASSFRVVNGSTPAPTSAVISSSGSPLSSPLSSLPAPPSKIFYPMTTITMIAWAATHLMAPLTHTIPTAQATKSPLATLRRHALALRAVHPRVRSRVPYTSGAWWLRRRARLRG